MAAWLGHDDLRTPMVYGKPTARAQEQLADVVSLPILNARKEASR